MSEIMAPVMRGVVSLVISVPLWYCQVFTCWHGYIIIDDMSKTRIGNRIIGDMKKMALVFEKDDGFWRKVWVYEYG